MDIGIDLGTTFSVAAVPGKVIFTPGYPQGEYLEEYDVTIIPTPSGDLTCPSVICLNDDPNIPREYIVGMEAKQAAERGEPTITCSKRWISTTELLKLGDRSLTARQAGEVILRHIKEYTELALGEPVRRAVITHPAYFLDAAVDNTREAAIDAGFEMADRSQMLKEPIAAALAYTRTDPRDPLTIMIYDLGGGTFDTTILVRNAGVIEVKASGGDPLLGGVDFDKALAEWIMNKQKERDREIKFNDQNPEDLGRKAQLMQLAEASKERLSSYMDRVKAVIEVRCDFLLDVNGNRIQVREKINQEDFQKIIQPDIDKTLDACDRCIAKAGMTSDDLDYMILIGGSSHGPWIKREVRKHYPSVAVMCDEVRPELVVAAGSAIHAKRLEPRPGEGEFPVVVTTVNPSPSITTNILGRVGAPEGTPIKSLRVLLRTHGGTTFGPIQLQPDGGFAFIDEVPLLDDGPTSFTLEVLDEEGDTRLKHGFTITYGHGDIQIPVVPILSRPLYIKTSKGMSLLADEGERLPTEEKEKKLKRLFSGESFFIEIFQENRKTNTIMVDDIPEAAGEGAEISIKVRITELGEIKGNIQVYAVKTKKIAAERPVDFKFSPAVINSLDELRVEFRKLDADLEDQMYLSDDDPGRKTILDGKGRKLVKEIEKLFAEEGGMGADRQKLDREIRELKRLLYPPVEKMTPPWSQFNDLVYHCYRILHRLGDDPQHDQYEASLEDIKQRGEEAYEKKDHHKWGIFNENLKQVYQKLLALLKIDAPPPQPPPPTEIQKEQSKAMVDQARSQLEHAREVQIKGDPQTYEKSFKSQCDKLEEQLKTMDKKIDEIDDNLNPESAQPRLRSIVHKLEKMLGIIELITTNVTTQEV